MQTNIDRQLVDSFKKILIGGYKVNDDRTGVGTTKIFGDVIRLNVSESAFQINRSKEIFFKGIVVELLWMMNGGSNTDYLLKHGVKYWNEWADADGNLGPIYGYQWRHGFRVTDGIGRGYSVDQLKQLINTINDNPNDRRQLVTAWNPGQLADMKLPPCHYTFQTFVRGNTLDLMMHQRSCDMFLGVPFDLTLYSLLLCILARITGKTPGAFVWTGGDCHIYDNHHEQVEKQIYNFENGPGKVLFSDTQLVFDDAIDFTSLDTFLQTTLDYPERISLSGYESMGKIPAPVAV